MYFGYFEPVMALIQDVFQKRCVLVNHEFQNGPFKEPRGRLSILRNEIVRERLACATARLSPLVDFVHVL